MFYLKLIDLFIDNNIFSSLEFFKLLTPQKQIINYYLQMFHNKVHAEVEMVIMKWPKIIINISLGKNANVSNLKGFHQSQIISYIYFLFKEKLILYIISLMLLLWWFINCSFLSLL